MSRRRGGLWRRTLWGGSEGGGLDPAEALLNEAAVRFDFSQYSDINNMVDVNGGWGPLDVTMAADTVEFTADGLRLANDLTLLPGFTRKIEGVASPVSFGPEGLTFVNVVLVDQPGDDQVSRFGMDLAGDSLDSYLPEAFGEWRAYFVAEAISANVSALAYGDVLDVVSDPSEPPNAAAAGVFVFAASFDVPNAELRVSAVGPVGRYDQTYPFLEAPDFSAQALADAVYIYGGGVLDETFVEDLIWNRAFTPAEVDTLITHFTPDPDPAQLLLNEAAVRFDFSQYTDINDMVDVNGGWGPLDVTSAPADVTEFTADGLVLTNIGLGISFACRIEEAGPLAYSPDGMTWLSVVAVTDDRTSPNRIFGFDIAADFNNNYAPNVFGSWDLALPPGQADDQYAIATYDISGAVVNEQAEQDDPTPNDAAGAYVMVVVVDVEAEQVRVTRVSPVATVSTEYAMSRPLDVAGSPVVDYINFESQARVTLTADETVVWNRALTPAEVDTLTAHFTA